MNTLCANEISRGYRLTKKKQTNKIEQEDPALHLNRARGHLNWRMGLPALLGGNLGCQIV